MSSCLKNHFPIVMGGEGGWLKAAPYRAYPWYGWRTVLGPVGKCAVARRSTVESCMAKSITVPRRKGDGRGVVVGVEVDVRGHVTDLV